jgi:NAD(P)-dependent dehydrogenase (short-subunit alcohol dehydrogenase family)
MDLSTPCEVQGWSPKAPPIPPGFLVEARGSVALVTGAQSELGQAFVRGLLEGGAAKVYADVSAARSIQNGRVIPMKLDMTARGDLARAVELCPDVNVVVVYQPSRRGVLGLGRRELDSTVYDVVRIVHAFAPALARNGGGAVINVLPSPERGYRGAGFRAPALSAAVMAMSEAMRVELKAQGTAVLGVHPGDLGAAGSREGRDERAGAARRLVGRALDALRAGQHQVFVDTRAEEDWAFTKDGSPALAAMG